MTMQFVIGQVCGAVELAIGIGIALFLGRRP